MASPNDVPMLPVSDTSSSSRTRPFTSLANTSSTIDVFENSTVVLGYTDPLGTQRRPPLVKMSDPLSSTRSPEPPFPLPPPFTGGSSHSVGASSSQPGKHEYHLTSGKLGMYNDPYRTTCPPDYNLKDAQIPTFRVSATSASTSHNALDDDAKGWARRFSTCVDKCLTRIRDPHTYAHIWTIFFVISCLLSIFVDPLFFYPIEIYKENMCIKFDWPIAKIITLARTAADILYCVNIVIQLPYAASRYRRLIIFTDFFIVMPLPQILLLMIIPYQLGTSWANTTKNLLRATVLIQYIPKLHRLFPLIAGQTPTGFLFESAYVKFFINLLTFMLAGHVVGSCWYLFGLQRVNQCLRDACGNSSYECKQLIDCGREPRTEVLEAWKSNMNATACFEETGFHYGIYWKAVNLTSNCTKWYTRYSYSLFWGFQQISTLAGNQVPSYFVWEVLFTMAIIGLGLFLFALLIGNMQNFLQSLGRRDMEMTLRRRDVKQWMRHRGFPRHIRKRVRNAERLNWKTNRGVNEESLFENMPDDLQRDIRRHLFAFLNDVSIFSKMNETILDAIRKRLKQRNYPEGSMVLRRGDPVENMVFIVTGKMMSTGEDGSPTPLLKGNVCGEELLTWCQKRSSVNPDGTTTSEELYSKRDVYCVKNVEAFSLSIADIEYVVALIPDSRDFYKES